MSPDRSLWIRLLIATLSAAIIALVAVSPLTPPSRAAIGPIPTPCDIPGADMICDVVGNAAKGAAQATAEFVMRGVTLWVTDAAVWVTGRVGSLINATASPNVRAQWFRGEYSAMVTVAGALALPMLLLALIQAVLRQDVWILLRSAFGYLPMAFILAGAAIVATQLVIDITDDLSRVVVGGLGESSPNLLQSVGDAYKHALDDTSAGAIPLFGIFLGAIVLAIGAFVLWLEMVIRDAAIYIALFFLPLTFVAMIWPATSRWARRLVELLIAVILAKFVVISILSLASAAITSTTLADTGGSSVFERMIAGAALLVLAAWSPFALLRLIPMMEVAAASVTSQRATMSNARGSTGVQTPAGYMRQAMDRHSRASTSPSSSGQPRATYPGGSTGRSTESTYSELGSSGSSGVRQDAPSGGEPRAAYAPFGGAPRRGGSTTVEGTREETVSDDARSGSVGSPPRPRSSDARRNSPEQPRGETPPPERPRRPQPPPDEE